MKKRHKYNAKGTYVDGLYFPSKAEARKYAELKLLQKVGKIRNLILQPSFPIVVNEVKICTYRADFQFDDAAGRHITDVKGVKTQVYRLKKRLVEALYKDVKIEEV